MNAEQVEQLIYILLDLLFKILMVTFYWLVLRTLVTIPFLWRNVLLWEMASLMRLIEDGAKFLLKKILNLLLIALIKKLWPRGVSTS